jgi:hypothetical protein
MTYNSRGSCEMPFPRLQSLHTIYEALHTNPPRLKEIMHTGVSPSLKPPSMCLFSVSLPGVHVHARLGAGPQCRNIARRGRFQQPAAVSAGVAHSARGGGRGATARVCFPLAVAKVVKPMEVVEVNQLLAKLHDKAFRCRIYLRLSYRPSSQRRHRKASESND